PKALIDEMNGLKERGIVLDGNLKVSKNAHVIMPYHIAIEAVKEARKGDKKIGTTGRGIGPAYVDKFARSGIRMIDLLYPEVLKEKIEANLDDINFILSNLYNAGTFTTNEIYNEYMIYAEQLRDYIEDTDIILNRAIEEGKNVLFEGAQGTLLDIDHGTYPYVTSSSAVAGGVCTGTGIGPTRIDTVLGVVKAYTTRVGSGPFPTEIHDELGAHIQKKGGEFGATTGRPRRCGWLDLIALRHAVRINGLGGLIITKLDILDGLDKIRLCTAYRYKNSLYTDFPKELEVLEKCTPVYEETDGWKESTAGVRDYNDLPENAKRYLSLIEERLGTGIDIISTGQKRNDIIILKDHFD
ncbi:MAG TPA: adenylosuccinate synthase, partial [Nitrospirae bacterium]|nr:adenylosuccinate synthase [Nitrospirota bacterium]